MTIEERLAQFKADAEYMGELKRLVKERSMIYQVQMKESMAQFWGLPLNAFYNLTYEEYREWSTLYWIEFDQHRVLNEAYSELPFPFGKLVIRLEECTPAAVGPNIFSAYKVIIDGETLPIGILSTDGNGKWFSTVEGRTCEFDWYIRALSDITDKAENDRVA